ncbi:hypothetical protein LCGC14_2049350 [marine sediment metagenome]|uniref:Uncharacterized protein n=1 Tax=marine sediment metagenome TaxID=412755 RepID=A0A0F9EPF2_9ZZZZ
MIGYEVTREDGTLIPGTLIIQGNSYIFTFDKVEVFGDEEAIQISIKAKVEP